MLLTLAMLASTHAEQAHAHGDATPLLTRGWAVRRQTLEPATPMTRVVYGYLPYWQDAQDVPWQHLTHLSYFAIEVAADGSFALDRGWSSGGAELVNEGRARGVQVTVTVTLFDNAQIGALLADPTARARLVSNIRQATLDADGVSIDFEFVPVAARDDFVTFVAELSTALPDRHVSLAVPAVDWSGAYDFDRLAAACDALLIMGYGYHWGGSDPGPTAPIDAGALWGGRDLRSTVHEYLRGSGGQRDKLVLGLPLYGRDWPATSGTVPGTRAGNGAAVLYDACQASFAVERTWEPVSQTPYRVYDQNGWHQLFCEDLDSMRAKLDLVLEYDLGGVMFWALGYAAPADAVWGEVDARFAERHELGRTATALVTSGESGCGAARPSLWWLATIVATRLRRRR